MKFKPSWLSKTGASTLLLLLLTFVLGGCAELDQLLKPRVEGLHRAPGFDGAALKEGGLGEIHIQSNLGASAVNTNSLEVMLVTAIREKRRDLIISPQGSYEIIATVLSDDITKRSDSYETHLYRWTKRNVKVNYQVTETQSGDQVWSGIIDTYSENFASFEFDKDEKNRDKVIKAVLAALSKEAQYPYPSPPLLSDVAKTNFQGFVLNLPRDK